MKLLRLPDVLARVPVDQATIYRWIKAGEFPAPVKIGKVSAWSSDELDAYLQKLLDGRKTAPAAEST